MGVNVETPNGCAAGCFHDQPGQDINQCGFARTIWPKQTEDRSLRNVKADIAERLFPPRIFFGEVLYGDSLFGHATAIAKAWWQCNHTQRFLTRCRVATALLSGAHEQI